MTEHGSLLLEACHVYSNRALFVAIVE